MEYQDHHEKRLMGARDHNYLTSGAFIKAMVGGALFGKTTAKGLKSCTPIAYHVDAEKVEAAKAEAKGVPFVSTNDVITSHFLRACRVRMAFMTINYRHPKRWAEIGDGMDAGNYEGCLLSDPAGHETPAAVVSFAPDIASESAPDATMFFSSNRRGHRRRVCAPRVQL